MKYKLFILFIFAALLLNACGANAPDEPVIVIEDPWVRAAIVIEEDSQDASEEDMAMASSTSAAYMRIRNEGKQDDRLIAVHGDVSKFVELHTTETRNGVSMMAKVNAIDIPGRRSVTLESGGLHVMLIKLNQDLRPGDTVELTLEFEKSGQIPVQAEVRAP